MTVPLIMTNKCALTFSSDDVPVISLQVHAPQTNNAASRSAQHEPSTGGKETLQYNLQEPRNLEKEVLIYITSWMPMCETTNPSPRRAHRLATTKFMTCLVRFSLPAPTSCPRSKAARNIDATLLAQMSSLATVTGNKS